MADAQEVRLTSIQNGISISDINPKIKTITEFKKKALFRQKLEELEKLICSREVINSNDNFNSLKRIIGLSSILQLMLRKSSESGMQGHVSITDFAENLYTRKTIKASLKFTKAGMSLSNKALKGVENFLLKHTPHGKILKEV